ncbi:MAG TPA: hypothetical protein VFO52_11790 [Longimicrobiales bacterium]|nr:hypothetical protein [Longimicrobiales bacterium]
MKFERFLIVALGVTLVGSGCDSASTDRLLAPQASVLIDSSMANTAVARTRALESGSRRYALVYPSVEGSVSVGGHTLKVPVGAVTQPTWFMLQVIEASAVHVRLKAWNALDGSVVTQFPNVPVELTLDVSDIEDLDLNGLVIVYLRDGSYAGAKEPVRTTISGSTTLTGYLTHFSQYAVAREYSIGID